MAPFDSESDGFWACHRLALATLPPHRLRALLDAAGGDPVRALTLRDGLTERQSARLQAAAGEPIAPRLRQKAASFGVRAVLASQPEYPPLLAPLDDAPPILFVRGMLPAGPGLAIVGSRRTSPYGRTQAAHFARAFAEAGRCVVSGGAAGIDTAAHHGALDAGGTSVAVVACGLDYIYPSENRGLFERIVERGGAIVSEFPVGTVPEPWRFPARNRIIAGMTPVTLVIEAPESSGALITARHAAEYGRDVFVVPGPVDTGRSRGGHRLIQDGAALADSPEDVLATPGSSAPSPASPAPELVGDEAALYAQLGPTPRHIDDAAEAALLATSQAAVAATLLEMKGLIRREPGGFFVRA